MKSIRQVMRTRITRLLLLIGTLISPLAARAQDATQWPHTVTNLNGATAVVYQPQAVSWPDQKTLTARIAVVITPAGAKTPILGTLELSFGTTIDNPTHLVALSDPKLITSHFPSLDTERAAQVQDRIGALLATLPLKQVPLEAIVLSLKELPQTAQPAAVNNDPPLIFHADRPASLVVFDADPIMAPAGNSGLKFAVNTNWEVFQDADGTWYLLNNGIWLSAPAATGPYKLVNKLPPAFSRLPSDANFADAREAIPPKPVPAAKVPIIFVSTKPAEIIVTDGPVQLAAIPGIGLQYVKNTASDLLFEAAQSKFYYLASGRWFSAPGLDGPWTFATDNLPADFALIPPEGTRGKALASVPGTSEAQLAVIQAQIPEQATLKRSEAKLTVTYAGQPQFKPIPGTDLTYAVNTSFQVIGVGDKYYACYQGAWFVGPTPNGPWVLADSIPPSIHSIPPSSPVYNVSYVNVYGSTPETVTYGYTAGYAMGFITAGLLVYGTGYYYPPYVAAGTVPVYYPYPYSYAGNVWYNSATGTWARGGTVYGPYSGAATAGAAYNPATGAWARGAAVYGPYGGAGAWSHYNPTTGTYTRGSAALGPYGGTANASFYNPRYGVSGSTTQNANAYSRWGSGTISTPSRTVNTASGSNARGSAGAFSSSTGAEGAGVHSNATGRNAGVARGANGNVYAGADGNVYRNTSSGWSKWNNGGWQPVQPPANTRTQGSLGSSGSASRFEGNGTRPTLSNSNYQQLEQDRYARFQGWRGSSASLGGRFGGWGGERFGDWGGGRFRR